MSFPKQFVIFDLFSIFQFIFKQARSFALRARGFSSVSASPAITGLRVKISIIFSAPQTHLGIRGGQKHFPASF